MVNKILGYRKMLSMTQKEMADKLGLSEGQYRAKEKGYYDFSKTEMEKFHELVHAKVREVEITDIFFKV